jgi:hypothetical protein
MWAELAEEEPQSIGYAEIQHHDGAPVGAQAGLCRVHGSRGAVGHVRGIHGNLLVMRGLRGQKDVGPSLPSHYTVLDGFFHTAAQRSPLRKWARAESRPGRQRGPLSGVDPPPERWP